MERKRKKVIKKICLALVGLGYILWSLSFFNEKSPSFWGVSINLYGRWVMALVGLIAIGCAFFYRKPKNSKKVGYYENTICPQCGKVYIVGSGPPYDVCTKCTVKLEPLEGFYTRHPELKEKAEAFPEKLEDI
ncbi:hypothetical protein [Desulfovibrio sp. UCD-KL4C]|uniref:hypothetical protein n=1 Tax=Desulfovibrio sp. UCD-KL4C TaxID=2578120 RepID=UPI0025C20CA1|nr:hypothetical protein [Desulfovibrio sp. UCD-KL4C]